MKLLLGLSIILLLTAFSLALLLELWRLMVSEFHRTLALLTEAFAHTPKERADLEASSKSVKLAEAKATLLRYKQSRKTTVFYDDTNEVKINPASGAYMLSEMYDRDGEFCATGGI